MESMSNIRKMAEQYFEDAVELRRRIHQQPELSMEEKETSALVREKLREYGISIAELPLETGVIGVLAGERPGRTIHSAGRYGRSSGGGAVWPSLCIGEEGSLP